MNDVNIFWSSTSSHICDVIVFFLLKFCVVHFPHAVLSSMMQLMMVVMAIMMMAIMMMAIMMVAIMMMASMLMAIMMMRVDATRALLLDSLLALRCGGYDGGDICIMF